jgi:hypothetical protein
MSILSSGIGKHGERNQGVSIMKTIPVLFSHIASLCILLSGLTAAAGERPASADGEKKPTARSVPFRGKIDVLDKSAKSFKVGTRTFQVVSETKIMKAGKPALIEDAAVGDEVGGAYREGEGGKLEVISLRLGPKPEKDSTPEKEKENDKEKKDKTE